MGIVNVTPDSFSDGGRFLEADAAVAHGLALVAAGADLLDVGGESTRPGAEPVDEQEELRRVLPVVGRLAAESGVPVSIDTSKAVVAAAALDAGATVVNDVAAATDPEMFGVVAAAGAGLVVMHMQGEPRTMQADPHYDDVVVEVGDFLLDRLAAARAAGIPTASLCADPGIGFGKTAAHNLDLLARLGELVARLDVPVLVGPSRKSFIARVLGDDLGSRGAGHARRRHARHRGLGRRSRSAHRARARCRRRVRRARPARGDGLDRRGGGGVKGRWAQGLEPRAFCWIIKDRLAASERPGGFARNHRKVRRQEELIWLIGHGFTHILSMLDSPHNLHAYDEAGIPHAHVPIGRHDEWPDTLPRLYATLAAWLGNPQERVLIHHEEFGDRLLGVLAGYLLYAGLVTEGPHATVVIEKITGRQLGSVAREIVAVTVSEGIVSRS